MASYIQTGESATMERSFKAFAAPYPQAGNQQGVALLAVLWLAVALSFMGMATANMVRTEVEAVSNQIDAERSYDLARGGIEAAVYSIARYSIAPPTSPDAPVSPSQYVPGKRWLEYQFSGGSCAVEIIPEQAKLNVNFATPEQLTALFAVLGAQPNDSLQLAAAIDDWRTPRTADAGTTWDLYYAALAHPYRSRHARLERLEELLPVKGMSHLLFFGRVERASNGRWQKWPPLADLLTAQAAPTPVNPNYAAEEILRSLPGWSDALAAEVVALRSRTPIRTMEELLSAEPSLAIAGNFGALTLAAGPVFTLTAIGSVPGSAVRRSVRARVYVNTGIPLYHRVLGWWDDWPSTSQPPQLAGPGENSKDGSST